MTLQLFNTLTGRKEEFKPIHPSEVRMYTCGPTVYDFAHIGNFRTFVFQDILKRYLRYKGFKVRHVMNVTDVDDKTIAGANKKGVSLSEFTKEYTNTFFEDLKTLGIEIPPKDDIFYATRTIPKMIQIIRKLVEKNHAYEKDGSVYFRVSSFSKYGELSKKDLPKNIVGARVEQDEYEKEEGADFALWKKAKEGEPAWDSPWGKGRPGWHMECSTMSLEAFDYETLDIHTGGEDLIFPHHENEIAQSECATGKKFVNYWLHAKHLLVDGEKMSKSKGNFYTLRDLLSKEFSSLAIRYLLISTHYRQPLNFTFEGVNAAKESLQRINDFWMGKCRPELNQKGESGKITPLLDESQKTFEQSMDDDLNVSGALASVFKLIRNVNLVREDLIHTNERVQLRMFLAEANNIFGFLNLDSSLPSEMQSLFEEYKKSKASKDYSRVDLLRKKAKDLGFCFEDVRDGVKVKKIL